MDSNNTGRAILSALLLNNAIWPQLTGVDPSDFSLEANRQIFRVSADLLHAGQPADVTTVVDELERRSELERIGGRGYLGELLNGLERKDIRPWVKILKREAGLRRVRHETEAISQLAAAPNADIGVLSRRLKDLGNEAAGYGDTTPQIRVVADLPDIYDCEIKPPDWLVDGLIPRGALILWAGTDRCAKTWLTLALSAAVAEGREFLGRKCVHGVAIYLDYENPGQDSGASAKDVGP